ncbi:MAG: response regulator [Anaerolineae bacterium]|nr:response regulator [Anaerolineae bacterium]
MSTKILVIEDAHALRKDIIEMLGFEGYEVRGAENGVLGVEAAREYRPDLIICDIMMPELDGYGVLAALQKDSINATIPFIFLTARTDKGDVRAGMELGANDYLTKPFTANELIKAVQTQLEKHERIRVLTNDKLNHLRDNIILALPHELRTPLTGILGFSDILAADCDRMSPDKISEMAQYIHSAAVRLYHLAENYLAYAQLEVILTDQNRIQSIRRFSTAYPRSVVENAVIQKAQEMQREADVVMEVNDDVHVHILEDNLKKIAEELADNAFKFSPPGTPIEVSSRIEKDQYVLTFVDHGRGIPPERIRDIGAYVQFGRKLYEQQGSGFGLAIVQRLAQLHGGEVDIDSFPDRETRVTVKLPLFTEAVAEMDSPGQSRLS